MAKNRYFLTFLVSWASIITGFVIWFILVTFNLPALDFLGQRLVGWMPLSILSMITIFVSIYMIYKLLKSWKSIKKTAMFIGIMFACSLPIYLSSFEYPSKIEYSNIVIVALVIIICIVSILKSLRTTKANLASELKSSTESIYIASSLAWISPVIAELYPWLGWYSNGIFWEKIQYMTLGGVGVHDLLFIFGFMTLSIMFLYYFLMRRFHLQNKDL